MMHAQYPQLQFYLLVISVTSLAVFFELFIFSIYLLYEKIYASLGGVSKNQSTSAHSRGRGKEEDGNLCRERPGGGFYVLHLGLFSPTHWDCASSHFGKPPRQHDSRVCGLFAPRMGVMRGESGDTLLPSQPHADIARLQPETLKKYQNRANI